MRFSKWQALGNTYLLVERGDLVAPLGADDVRRLCDPHQGVGADGVLEIGEVRGAEADVVVWNPATQSASVRITEAGVEALVSHALSAATTTTDTPWCWNTWSSGVV